MARFAGAPRIRPGAGWRRRKYFDHVSRALYQVMTNRYLRMLTPVHQVAESGVSLDEHVLLGCFGLDLTAVRHKTQLRLALRRAGYPPALAAQLIRDSPLLVREAAGRGYRLRRCDEHDANATDR